EVPVGGRHKALTDCTVEKLANMAPAPAEQAQPRRLTARGARLLQVGRALLRDLRALAEEPLLQSDEPEPVADLYYETAAMLDTVLRTVPAFPESPSAQARLCDGLEGVLDVAGERLGGLRVGLAQRRRHADQLDRLTEFLAGAASGHALSLDV